MKEPVFLQTANASATGTDSLEMEFIPSDSLNHAELTYRQGNPVFTELLVGLSRTHTTLETSMGPQKSDYLTRLWERLRKSMAPEEPTSTDVIMTMLREVNGPPADGTVFGWWNYNPQEEKRIQVQSGRSLRFRGRVWADEALRISNTANQYWMRFDYADDQGTYPLLVEWRNLPRNRGRVFAWRLDHLRSAALWKKETGSGDDHPPLARWYAIDQFALDALATWPKREALGPHPIVLAVLGGWADGRWTPSLYRKMSTIDVTRSDERKPPRFSPLEQVQPPPQQWQFIPASRVLSLETEQELLQRLKRNGAAGLENTLPELIATRPHLRTIDGERIVLPLFLWMRQKRELGHIKEIIETIAWLYLDQDYVTDRLEFEPHPGAHLEWGLRTDMPHMLGTIRRGDGMALEEHPLQLTKRLEDLAANACWAWPGTETQLGLVHFNGTGSSREVDGIENTYPVHIKTPAIITVTLPVCGGVSSFGRLSHARSLGPNTTGLEHEMDYYFIERDGYVHTAGVTKTFGRFDFDPTAVALIDRLSGRRLKYITTLSPSTGPRSGAKHRFEYEGPDGTYPLIVDWPPVIREGKYGNRELPMTEVDHTASLELWRKTSGPQTPFPPRDFWASMDEFTAQALVCWPEIRLTGAVAKYCVRCGGWFAGKWHDSAIRKLGLSTDHYVPGARPDDSFNMAGTYKTPHWEECNVEAPPLPHGERLDQAFTARFLDSGALPGEMAGEFLRNHSHFRRSDGKAIIFICERIEWGRQEPGFARSLAPVLQYCDQDIWLQFRGSGPSMPSVAHISNPKLPKGSCFGSLDGILSHERSWFAPGPAIWERTASAFMGLFGVTPEMKIVTIDGGYVAGEWLPAARFITQWNDR